MIGVTKTVRKLQRERPSASVAAIEACLGVRLRPIGHGAFRAVYQIGNLPIVAKLPRLSDFRDSKKHSRQEAARYKKLRRFPLLRPSLPRVYLYDSKTGLLIIEYIAAIRVKNGVSVAEQKLVASNILMEKLIKSLTGIPVSDIVENNLSVRDQHLMFLDLGL